MSPSTILHIGAKKEALTKRQKDFNRLVGKIDQLEKSLVEFRAGRDLLHQKVSKEMTPLFGQMHTFQVEMVRNMDRIYQDKIFKKTDHKKLSHLITDLCFSLISKHGFDDLKAIFNKYNDEDYDAVNAELDRQTAEIAKGMASLFGVEFEEDEDFSTPEKFREKMFERLLEKEEAFEEKRRILEEKKAARPKTKRQIEKEEKQKSEEHKVTKSVRAIYMDLVKAFHPDREKDDTEKQRKTDIMQRVTQAYNENNLMALLRLQMEFNRIDKEHLENLLDEQLLYYNKVLKEQVADLEEEKFAILNDLSELSDLAPYEIRSVQSLLIKFNSDLRMLKKDILDMKDDAELWCDPVKAKAWLKTYRIPKDNEFDFF